MKFFCIHNSVINIINNNNNNKFTNRNRMHLSEEVYLLNYRPNSAHLQLAFHVVYLLASDK